MEAAPGELLLDAVESDLVPSPVEYAVLLPAGHESSSPLPLLLWLHGGGSDRSFLSEGTRGAFEALWAAGRLAPMAVATPSAGQSFYMDYLDGSERWERFLLGPFLDHLHETLPVSREREGTFVGGISMGGVGALRLAFKHPERFAAVVAMQPAMGPGFAFGDLTERYLFWREGWPLDRIYGDPVDEAHWAANHPPAIARDRSEVLRASGLAVYLDAAGRDVLNFDDGAEFLHRVLWDRGVPHDYHVFRDADHVGSSLLPRILQALEFLARVLAPAAEPDVQAEALLAGSLGERKREAERLHPEEWRGECGD